MLTQLKSRWKLFLWRRKPYAERVAIVTELDRLANTPENRAKAWDEFLDSLRRPIPHWYGAGRVGGLRPEEIPAHIAYQKSQGWPVDPPDKYF